MLPFAGFAPAGADARYVSAVREGYVDWGTRLLWGHNSVFPNGALTNHIDADIENNVIVSQRRPGEAGLRNLLAAR